MEGQTIHDVAAGRRLTIGCLLAAAARSLAVQLYTFSHNSNRAGQMEAMA